MRGAYIINTQIKGGKYMTMPIADKNVIKELLKRCKEEVTMEAIRDGDIWS